MKKMLTSHQVALRLSITEKTLRYWRSLGKGPRYVKLGPSRTSLIRYDEDEVERWKIENSYDPLD